VKEAAAEVREELQRDIEAARMYPCGQPLILTMSGPPGGRERRHLA
jgi:hypothetical protein